MPTRAERNALLFFSAVFLVGVGARVVRAARGTGHPSPADSAALALQIAAVDSANAEQASDSGGGRRRRRRSRSRGAVAAASSGVVARVPTVTGLTTSAPSLPTPIKPPAVVGAPLGPIDLDRASATEIEALPRIGPTLARRIVAERDSGGPFGSLEGLQRVRGIGPKMADAIRPYVTFSGTARPASTGGVPPKRPAGSRHPD